MVIPTAHDQFARCEIGAYQAALLEPDEIQRRKKYLLSAFADVERTCAGEAQSCEGPGEAA